MYELIYHPQKNNETPIEATLGVKFNEGIFVSTSFLDQHNIQYTEDDLEDTPLGKMLNYKEGIK